MKVHLPFIIQDQLTAGRNSLEPIGGVHWDSARYEAEVFLDGPISSRVAVLDFDESTGALQPPVRFDDSGKLKSYDVPRSIDDRGFQAVSIFSTVLETLHMFESADVLGRRIVWAFDGPQLLVVPRAGRAENAYYERESRSLQFFSFDAAGHDATIHTALSHDIVAHETGHAILDAIAPHLYDCVTPESLAIHEAMGDLTALFTALDIDPLRAHLLEQAQGNIAGLNPYNQVAEEFGFNTGRGGALRTLWNDETMSTVPDHNDFHDLCQVLTGAVYKLLVHVYEKQWKKTSPDGPPDVSQSGKALWSASQAVKRVALRGLDYLPPGEITFADYGRAVIAADAVSNPHQTDARDTFAELLVARGIGTPESLAYVRPVLSEVESAVDLAALADSDWHGFDLVNRHREAFHVPPDTAFQIDPRLRVTKKTWRSGAAATYNELIIKVAWETQETTGRKRWVRFGTTMVFDPDTGRVTAVLTNNPDVTGEDQAADRGRFLQFLLDNELVDPGGHALGAWEASEAAPSPSHTGGALRLRGTGRCLHLAGGTSGARLFGGVG